MIRGRFGDIPKISIELHPRKAFPSASGGFKAYKTGQTQCGDIVLQLNDQCRIMVEVKNYEKGTVKSQRQGHEVKKFFEDAQQTKLENK